MQSNVGDMVEGVWVELVVRCHRVMARQAEHTVWMRVGTIQRVANKLHARFDGDGEHMAPVWVSRHSAATSSPFGMLVEFAAVVEGRYHFIAQCWVSRRAVGASFEIGLQESQRSHTGMVGGGPARLRSNYREPRRVARSQRPQAQAGGA